MKLDLGVELIGLSFVKTCLNGKKETVFRAASDQEAKDILKLLEDRGSRNRTVGVLIGIDFSVLLFACGSLIYGAIESKRKCAKQQPIKEMRKEKPGKFKVGFCAADEKTRKED